MADIVEIISQYWPGVQVEYNQSIIEGWEPYAGGSIRAIVGDIPDESSVLSREADYIREMAMADAVRERERRVDAVEKIAGMSAHPKYAAVAAYLASLYALTDDPQFDPTAPIPWPAPPQ